MFRILKESELPEFSRPNRRGASRKYPWEELEIGDGFMVPADQALWRESICKNGPEKGRTTRVSSVAQAASGAGRRYGKKFKTHADEAGNVYVKRIA